jgi:hypothetical protein
MSFFDFAKAAKENPRPVTNPFSLSQDFAPKSGSFQIPVKSEEPRKAVIQAPELSQKPEKFFARLATPPQKKVVLHDPHSGKSDSEITAENIEKEIMKLEEGMIAFQNWAALQADTLEKLKAEAEEFCRQSRQFIEGIQPAAA